MFDYSTRPNGQNFLVFFYNNNNDDSLGKLGRGHMGGHENNLLAFVAREYVSPPNPDPAATQPFARDRFL